MDEGRIAGTPDIWDATQLSTLDVALDVDWECPGCTLPVFPAAWLSSEHKVTAHFKKRKLTEHHPECLYDLICRSGPKSLTHRKMGSPRPWVDSITFPDVRVLPPRAKGTGQSSRRPPELVEHSATRHSINAACQFHHAVKGNRREWALQVEGVRGHDYFDVFSPARYPPTQDPEARIWFGDLHVHSEPEVIGDSMNIALAERLVGSKARPSIQIRVNFAGWSPDQRRLFTDRLQAVRSTARWTTHKQPSAPVIYALGPRYIGMPETIRLDHPRKFAIVIPV